MLKNLDFLLKILDNLLSDLHFHQRAVSAPGSAWNAMDRPGSLER